MATHFLGSGNGNPLQYSCLENPMDWNLSLSHHLWVSGEVCSLFFSHLGSLLI